ncbi:hypothetical protein N7510_000935 [Penicillium lagena]|uniref:uncharacterized protein n=1 Tax=Penicillium lagena TaxID=94218 RepID=UPI002540162B|nr:uncharacterized protein N7510_000935 [Penicillium lagena]KAJ5624626.1 hypothetical protein N7510_000935 [Penicillium lagena]
MCENGKCCPIGETCVTDGCCPAGGEECGSEGCYNPEEGESCCGGTGKKCPEGYFCTETGCCPTGTKQCGTGCYDPETEVCCNDEEGHTCEMGYDCMKEGGCCPTGMISCGNDKCYDPETSVCCPGGSGLCGRQIDTGTCALDTVCAKGMTCVDGNQCCPEGQKLCGTKRCYDPETEVCCNDEEGHTCEMGYDCMKGGDCCPTGMIKCGKDKCYDPKTSMCCQDAVGSKNWACKDGFQCCVASEGCFDSKTQRCCADPNGPCDIDAACCGGKCCPKGYGCNKNNKCYKKPTTTRSSKTKQCKTPTPTRVAPSPMVTVPFVYDPRRRLQESADPTSDEIFEISNRAVLMNMCEGMKKLNGGKGTQEYQLTYAGPGKRNCWKIRNRRIMCPQGFCAKAVDEYVNQFYPDGIPNWAKAAIEAAGDMECDEFPFANSLQGGDAVSGTAMCIPSDDNSFQGQSLSGYFSRKDIVAGEDYVIKIVGWNCDKQEPMRRRRDDHDATVEMSESLMPILNRLAKRDAFDEPVPRYGGKSQSYPICVWPYSFPMLIQRW